MSKKRVEIEPEQEHQDKDLGTKSKDWAAVSNREAESEMVEDVEPAAETPGAALEHPSYENLEERLTEAEQQAQKNYDQLLRVQAEYNNFKARMEKDMANARKFAVDRLVQDVIPVLDSLDQGLEIQDFKNVKEGVLHQVRAGMELTYKMLLDILNKYGIEQINPEGQPFNPALHEAMSMQEDPDIDANVVLKVFQKGFTLHGRLLRPARVIVSKG